MHEQWIKLAEELSLNCIDPHLKVGCVLVKDGKKISEGWNRVAEGGVLPDQVFRYPVGFERFVQPRSPLLVLVAVAAEGAVFVVGPHRRIGCLEESCRLADSTESLYVLW